MVKNESNWQIFQKLPKVIYMGIDCSSKAVHAVLIDSTETETLLAEETEDRGGITSSQLSVVAQTMVVARNSNSSSGVLGNTGSWGGAGTSTNNSQTNNNTAVSNSSSSGGFSTSSSPSISDQIQTAQVQTNTILSMSGDAGTVNSVTTNIPPMPGLANNPQVVMSDVQVTDMQGQIDTAVSGVMTASEADQIADQIIANNIKEQQEQAEIQQQETGKYGDQSTLVAYLGYVPAFEVYRGYEIPKQEVWYQPREIYANVSMSDNIDAFYGLASTSLNKMGEMINQQPTL